MGYDFATAVADVIDNSIEARATRIDVDVHFDGDESWVRIVDNGTGMKPATIREALRYGAEREYDEKEALGKFGLGLKTASLSQCQKLIVASRSSSQRAEIYAYCWDMEHVVKANAWEILEFDRNDPELSEPLQEHTGTVVMWQRLDRILGYKHPYGELAKKRLSTMCRELEEHLAMVFHRYIAGEAGRRKVRIRINGNVVKAWDPFVREEAKTKSLEPISLTFDHDGIRGEILIEPYVLPHQDDFQSPQAHSAAAGPLKWNRQQGLYIYRANRMIQSGGWSNLRTLDEHTKLARVAVSFDPRLDEAFRVNVAKMRVQLPQLLRGQFEKAIVPVIKIAQNAYRRPGKGAPPTGETPPTPPRPPGGKVGGGATASPPTSPSPPTNVNRRWSVSEIRRAAERVATADERPIVERIFDRLVKDLA